MKHDTALTVTSVLSVFLLIMHLSGDIIFGMDKPNRGMLTAILILIIYLYAALALRGRRSGYIILLLGSLAAVGMPVLHMGIFGLRPNFGQLEGAFFFIATLLAVGTTGGVAFVLCIQGLRGLRRAETNAEA